MCGLMQVFDQRLGGMDSTVNQLESSLQHLVDAGYLSDDDAGKRQVGDVTVVSDRRIHVDLLHSVMDYMKC